MNQNKKMHYRADTNSSLSPCSKKQKIKQEIDEFEGSDASAGKYKKSKDFNKSKVI